MTDLNVVLPGFPTQQYLRLLPSLEKNLLTTADLITLDHVEVAKRARLPVLDVKRLCNAVLEALQSSLGITGIGHDHGHVTTLKRTGQELVDAWTTITTLDDKFDLALGGGIPTGYITEVTGESGAGKTQFLLTLLLSVQLPAPQGISGAALYISTESALPTTRLSQLLKTHSVLTTSNSKPTLGAVHSIVTPDLESQDHILRFQVPVAVRKYGIRLIILDSVAANYRAEFERSGTGSSGQKPGANMAQRSSELVKLGQLLRDIARDHNIAVVVANQVADRFSFSGGGDSSPSITRATQSSPLARRGTGDVGALPSSSIPLPPSTLLAATSEVGDPMSLDHQQRWFTGWGDSPQSVSSKNLKTPSLGLIWTTQIACRIALIKRPVYGPGLVADEENERGEPVLRRWRRWMKVVFAPHAAPSGAGLEGAVEFEILGRGIASVEQIAADVEGGAFQLRSSSNYEQ